MGFWAATAWETAQHWEQDAIAAGEGHEILGGVDATFLERMMLVFQDLPTGYLVLEDVADARPFATWKAWVDTRLKALGTEVWYRVSDRAKALIQLAEHGLGCRSMPDCFPLMHDIVKRYSLAMARQLRQAPKALQTAAEALARHSGLAQADHDGPDAQAALEASRSATLGRGAQCVSAPPGDAFALAAALRSLRLHSPDVRSDRKPVASGSAGHRNVSGASSVAGPSQRHEEGAQTVTGLGRSGGLLGEGVRRDVDQAAISPMWRRWAQESLLPLVYWEHQVAHTRCAQRQAKMRQALEAVQAAFAHHAITQCLPPQALQEWHAWATQRVSAFQRASSAVEGRNGSLAPLQHHQRGLPKHRDKVWTVRHHFDCRAGDGTTPASRFFRRTFPDLFETVLSHIEALPQPRRRKHQVYSFGGEKVSGTVSPDPGTGAGPSNRLQPTP